MKLMDRKDVFEYVKKQYGTVPEYLWKESPESAVLRHKNGKWYAVLMQVKKSKLELKTVLIDSHLRHAVAAQFLAARQEDDFRVLGGNQFGQLRAVGV